MVTVIERTEAHYDVEDVEFGRVYKWRPESVLIECDCGERLTLTPSTTTCRRCGKDHAAVLQKEPDAGRSGDEVLHPWRYAREREGGGLPY